MPTSDGVGGADDTAEDAGEVGDDGGHDANPQQGHPERQPPPTDRRGRDEGEQHLDMGVPPREPLLLVLVVVVVVFGGGGWWWWWWW